MLGLYHTSTHRQQLTRTQPVPGKSTSNATNTSERLADSNKLYVVLYEVVTFPHRGIIEFLFRATRERVPNGSIRDGSHSLRRSITYFVIE